MPDQFCVHGRVFSDECPECVPGPPTVRIPVVLNPSAVGNPDETPVVQLVDFEFVRES
jgi:hypothetical protein